MRWQSFSRDVIRQSIQAWNFKQVVGNFILVVCYCFYHIFRQACRFNGNVVVWLFGRFCVVSYYFHCHAWLGNADALLCSRATWNHLQIVDYKLANQLRKEKDFVIFCPSLGRNNLLTARALSHKLPFWHGKALANPLSPDFVPRGRTISMNAGASSDTALFQWLCILISLTLFHCKAENRRDPILVRFSSWSWRLNSVAPHNLLSSWSKHC